MRRHSLDRLNASMIDQKKRKPGKELLRSITTEVVIYLTNREPSDRYPCSQKTALDNDSGPLERGRG